MPRGPQSGWSRGLVILVASIVIAMLAACSGAPKPVYFPGYPIGFVERGVASWYGPGFHGNKTANGERYDMQDTDVRNQRGERVATMRGRSYRMKGKPVVSLGA